MIYLLWAFVFYVVVGFFYAGTNSKADMNWAVKMWQDRK